MVLKRFFFLDFKSEITILVWPIKIISNPISYSIKPFVLSRLGWGEGGWSTREKVEGESNQRAANKLLLYQNADEGVDLSEAHAPRPPKNQ